MLDPDKLDLLLIVLQDRGVTQFTCPEFSLTLGPKPYDGELSIDTQIKEATKADKAPAPRGVYAHKSLWPDGRPAAFPGAE